MLKNLIVTVAYNPSREIISNLRVDYYPHMIVDNSEQETVWLKDYCLNHGHVYQWLGDNFGIARALNVGAEYAIQHEFDYIVTMDQDSILTANLLEKMEEFINGKIARERVAVFSPRHINPGADLCVIKSEISNDFYAMSSGNFVNLKIWQTLGGFTDELFIDMVDVEYYVRALLANYQVMTIQRITMLHHLGENSHTQWIGKYGFDVWNHGKIRKYYQARNFWYVYSKYYKQMPELIFIKKMIRKMPITILFFEKDKLAKLYYYFRGYIDYLRGQLGKIYF